MVMSFDDDNKKVKKLFQLLKSNYIFLNDHDTDKSLKNNCDLFDQMPFGTVICDLNGEITFVSSKFYELIEYPLDLEILGVKNS